MKFIGWLAMVLFSCVCLGTESEYSIDRLDWHKQLSKNASISVENLYGNVLLRKTEDDRFIMHAVNQNHNSHKSKARFLVEQQDDHTTIKVVFESKQIWAKERSDITIVMPHNIPLSLTMHAGKFTAKNIKNPINLKAESTEIYLSTNSAFNLLSKFGDIFVKILPDGKPQTSSMQSYEGDITLEYLLKNPHIDVVSGTPVVSNSAALLMTKKQSNRHILFNDVSSPTKIQIKNDTGDVILIDKNVN